MTVQQAALYIGKKGFLMVGNLQFAVVCKDVKEAWGRQRFLVKPVAGEGETWTESVCWEK